MNIKKQIKQILKIDSNCRWYYELKFRIGSLPYYVMRIFPIERNKVVFTSFTGKYGGDPKYLSEALHQIDDSIDLVWLLKEPKYCDDSYVRIVPYGSLRSIYELVTAKIWIDDCRKEGVVRKRKGQFYIGTGHGGIPMKKIEKDAEDKLEAVYLMLAENDSRMTDLKPSNSQWRNDMLRRAFWYNGEIMNCGLPRVERLIKEQGQVRDRIRRRYSISMEDRVFLYAPTFRSDGDIDVYNLDFHLIGEALGQRFGGKWVGLRRLHPNVLNYNKVNIPGIVIDTTDYPDMEDLIMASDLLITDYSSCIFETFFLNIPAFIFATDIKKYTERERGLYWNIEQMPFLRAISNEELANKIKNYDPVQFEYGLKMLREELGLFEDQTHAIEKLVDRILNEMKR